MRRIGLGLILPPGSVAPQPRHFIHKVTNRLRVGLAGTKIPSTLVLGIFAIKTLSQQKVSAERFQYVLPRAHRMRIAHANGLVAGKRPNNVWHNAIRRPVASTYDVTCAGAGHIRARRGAMKEAATISGGHQLGAAFAAAVWIVAAHGLVFAIGLGTFAILVALVAGDADDGADRWRAAHGVEHMRRAHHVDRVCLQWLLITEAHQRLRRHVDDHLGLEPAHGRFQRGKITHVTKEGFHLALQPDGVKHAGVGGRLERVAINLRAQAHEPEREPAPLEAGVAGYKDPSGFPEAYFHTCQAALPAVQSCSS